MGRRKTLRVLIWMFLSVLQRRDRRGRFSSTVTARRDTWLAATAPVSRLPTFATGVSTVPTAPTKVAGAVRKNEFFVTHSLSSFFRAVFCIFFFFFDRQMLETIRTARYLAIQESVICRIAGVPRTGRRFLAT